MSASGALAAAAAVRRRQRVEELCAAAARAVAGEADLRFRGRRLHRGGRPLPAFAPHLHPSAGEDDFASSRGAADGIALRLAGSDAALHARLAPADEVGRLVYDLLEQLRVESLAPPSMPGLRANLRHRFERWSLAFHDSGLTETSRGVLLYAVAQTCRARVTGEPVLEATEGVIEHTRGALTALLGGELGALRRLRADQAAYAACAASIARRVAALLTAGEGEDDGAARPDARALRNGFSLLIDPQGDGQEGYAPADAGFSRVLDESADGYRVYTRAYDRELPAAALVRPALLAEYRERIDRRIAEQGLGVPRLARRLQALLARPRADGWDGGQEEGLLDGRRLAQLVASPAERRLFRTERVVPAADCLVSFLIDCSGSMKEHAEPVAILVDAYARALEMAGAAVEVLGHTTGAWNGGRARRDWQRAGRPRHPGRLNEVDHLVFKRADTPWRRARRDIAALLKADLYREGVDGEAVDWACARMESRAEARRLLVVVSDGSPMDAATHLANDRHYLDHHLREAVSRQAARGVEVLGVGVGLDLSPYYPRSQALDLSAGADGRACADILALVAGSGRR